MLRIMEMPKLQKKKKKKKSNYGALVHPVAPDRSPFHESCGSNVEGKKMS